MMNFALEIETADDRGYHVITISNIEEPDMFIEFCIRDIKWPQEIMEAIAKSSAGQTP